jgi:hypothetical protein
MNKYRFFGAIAAIGIFLTCFGALQKILHNPSADLILTIGLITAGVGNGAYAWLKFEKLKDKKE